MELSCAECMSSAETERSDVEMENVEVCETTVEQSGPIAPDDPFMNWDPRVLDNLFAMENSSIATCDYFEHVQDDIQPFMRKVVTSWMLDVCVEQLCEEQVFPLAVCLLDKFLCESSVPRSRLQLLACATLLIASKLRQAVNLNVSLLVEYTDRSITESELISWELLVLQVLQWRISLVTAFDFIEILLARTSTGPARKLLRGHAHTLSALCYTEYDFLRMKPSLLAAACIESAARGLSNGRHAHLMTGAETLIEEVYRTTSSCPITVNKMVCHIEMLIRKETASTMPHKTAESSSSAGSSLQPTTPQQVEDVVF